MKDKKTYSLVDYNKMVDSFHAESERGAAVLAASFVECFLEKSLRHFLRNDHIVDNLFKGYGPFATFSSKSDTLYALKVFDKNMYNDSKFIRKVRNHFAHQPEGASFDKSPVKDFCQKLSTSGTENDLKSVFLVAVGLAVGRMHNMILANPKRNPEA